MDESKRGEDEKRKILNIVEARLPEEPATHQSGGSPNTVCVCVRVYVCGRLRAGSLESVAFPLRHSLFLG